jgi:hypothetical protein
MRYKDIILRSFYICKEVPKSDPHVAWTEDMVELVGKKLQCVDLDPVDKMPALKDAAQKEDEPSYWFDPNWIEPYIIIKEDEICECDLILLMNRGCQCGAFGVEQKNKKIPRISW